jgi:hypothetical protein
MKNIMSIFSLLAITLLVACAQPEARDAAPANDQPVAVNLLAEPAQTQVAWETEVHDFGKIPKDQPAEFTFSFTNEGDEPLQITNVKASCSCTASEWSRDPIAPGESGFVTAGYNAKAVGMFNKTITVFSNAADSVKVLRFSGEVVE